MARTVDGIALTKPLSGITGYSNIEPHLIVEPIDVFEDWHDGYKLETFEALAEQGMHAIIDFNLEDDEDLSDQETLNIIPNQYDAPITNP